MQTARQSVSGCQDTATQSSPLKSTCTTSTLTPGT